MQLQAIQITCYVSYFSKYRTVLLHCQLQFLKLSRFMKFKSLLWCSSFYSILMFQHIDNSFSSPSIERLLKFSNFDILGSFCKNLFYTWSVERRQNCFVFHIVTASHLLYIWHVHAYDLILLSTTWYMFLYLYLATNSKSLLFLAIFLIDRYRRMHHLHFFSYLTSSCHNRGFELEDREQTHYSRHNVYLWIPWQVQADTGTVQLTAGDKAAKTGFWRWLCQSRIQLWLL